jgi:cytochrome bd-type quinol oxidase subunit 2
MQTTLVDFACVLAVLLVFIHRDARAHGLTYWWILPTFPVMPIIGILLYFMVRKQKLPRRAHSNQISIS